MKIRLIDIAHARSGDKGDTGNVGVIARKEEYYPILVKYLTVERVQRHFEGIVLGKVERFELPNLWALNFLLHERARRRRNQVAEERRAGEDAEQRHAAHGTRHRRITHTPGTDDMFEEQKKQDQGTEGTAAVPPGVSLTSTGRKRRSRSSRRRPKRPSFWNDNVGAQKVMQQIAARKEWIDAWNGAAADARRRGVARSSWRRNRTTSRSRPEIDRELAAVAQGIDDLEFRNMLSGEDDERNAILTIHAGAGGTEAQDWAEMLLRMYLRWCEAKGYKAVPRGPAGR